MSTNNKLNEYVKEEMAHLPKELQEAVNAFGWENITEEIGERNKLPEKEALALKVETALVLIGLVSPTSYRQNLEDNMGLSEKEASQISKEIDQKIFIPIGNVLEEKIKKNLTGKDTTWDQNLNFVLSGGDYSSFIPKRSDIIDNTTPAVEQSSLRGKQNG